MNYFFVKLLKKLGVLKNLKVSVTNVVNDKKITIPVINELGFDNLFITELWMCELLKKVLPLKNGAFIDVGVNVGQTLIKLRSVNDDRDYVGFEPNPLCVYYTGELIKANHYHNARLLPIGLFNKDGILQLNLYSDGDTDQAASVIENFRPAEKVYRKVFVPVGQFTNVSESLNIDEIAIIKIDVEGAELEVLQSIESTLLARRPFVLVEILPVYNESNTDRLNRQMQIEKLLNSLQYYIFRIDKEKHLLKGFQKIGSIGVHGNLNMCDYILVPKESIKEFESLNLIHE